MGVAFTNIAFNAAPVTGGVGGFFVILASNC